jgi:hypothetical protein
VTGQQGILKSSAARDPYSGVFMGPCKPHFLRRLYRVPDLDDDFECRFFFCLLG